MQFSTIFATALFLTASSAAHRWTAEKPNRTQNGTGSSAAPSSSGSSNVKSEVEQTINNWLNDIDAVNTFVDTTKATAGNQVISAAASTAFKAAQDEGASNTALQQDVVLSAAGASAAQALLPEFNIIGPAINDTIFFPGNLEKNLAAINGARCPPPVGTGAITLEGDVQAAAASAVGITIQPPATPAACNAAAKRTF